MPKQAKSGSVDFGKRLAELRKAAGYTQQQLADEIGARSPITRASRSARQQG